MRHPPADIAPGICYGRLDLPLAAGGKAGIAAIVAEISAILPARTWTSPACRCRCVADAIGGPVTPDDRLLELDFGAWEGRAWDDVPRADFDRWAASPERFAAPGGETGDALVKRVASFHAMLRATGGDAIVVSHGGPLKLLRRMLADEPVDLLAPAPALGSVRLVSVPPSAR